MPSESVRELAREYPEAFESVAKARDDKLRDAMLTILDDVAGEE